MEPITNIVDDINWVTRKINITDSVTVDIQGFTVRALRTMLEKADPDALVVYNRQPADGSLFLAGIAGQYAPTDANVIYLLDLDTVQTIQKRLQEPKNN